MENALQKCPDVNVVYTINEPAAAGAWEALKAVGKDDGSVLIVSIDGGCPGVENVKAGVIGATSQQYPHKMAVDGARSDRVGHACRQIDPAVGLPRHRRDADHRQAGRWRRRRSRSRRASSSAGADRPSQPPDVRLDFRLSEADRRQSAARLSIRELGGGAPDERRRGRLGDGREAGSPAQRAVGRQLRRGASERRSAGCSISSTSIPTTIPVIILVARRRDLRRSSARGKFFSPLNLSLILQQVTIIAMLGIAQTLVILTAGIDLSVGADHDPLPRS